MQEELSDYEILVRCTYSPNTMSREELIAALANEIRDIWMLSDHCSKIYVWATNSRISNSRTLPREVIAVAEDIREEEITKMIADENDEIKKLIQDREARIERAIKRQRRNNIIILVAQYSIVIVIGFALYLVFS